MILTGMVRMTPALRSTAASRAVAHSTRSVVTWAEQDNWEDPRGPLGIDRPSPKLAPLTAESPKWLHDLHNNGVCDALTSTRMLLIWFKFSSGPW